jgi:hypothetical protein
VWDCFKVQFRNSPIDAEKYHEKRPSDKPTFLPRYEPGDSQIRSSSTKRSTVTFDDQLTDRSANWLTLHFRASLEMLMVTEVVMQFSASAITKHQY